MSYAPALLSSLDELAGLYDAVLCDIWGVVHNGREAYASATAALRRFRQAGGTVVLVSNVPKPREPIPGQLARLGVGPDVYDGIVTSGDAIRTELKLRAPGPMYRIGPVGFDDPLWEGLDLHFEPRIEAAAFIGVSGLNDDATETPADYRPLFEAARERDLELLCANPDIQVRVGDRLVWCAGALARDYAALGGRVVMAGKPYPPIYALARAEVSRLRGRPVSDSRLLAIGDGMATDIRGANQEGVDALFVAEGLNGAAFFDGARLDPARAAAALAAQGLHARYVMGQLA